MKRKIANCLRRIANHLDWYYPMSSLYRYRAIMDNGEETCAVKMATDKGHCWGVWHEPCGRFIELDDNGYVIGWSTLSGVKVEIQK